MHTLFKQAQTLIKQSKNVAIVLPRDFDLDHYLAASSLIDALHTTGKAVQLFADNNDFMAPGFSGPKLNISDELINYDDLVIKVDSTKTSPEEIRYESKSDGLYIYIKPQTGNFSKEDVMVIGKDFTPDLFIIIGANNYDSLGRVFRNASEIFSKTPQLIIDTKIDNELFGQVNLVQSNYSSTCELVLDLLRDGEMNLSLPQTKTNLLAGMMFKTNSFTNYNTLPQVYEKAAQLMSQGADKQAIVRELYKTKSLPALRLWGRVLARATSTDAGILFSTILPSDLEKTQSLDKDVAEAFRDLVGMADDFKTVILINNHLNSLRLFFAVRKQIDPRRLLQNLDIQEFSLEELNQKYNYCEISVNHVDIDNLLQKIQTLPTDLL